MAVISIDYDEGEAGTYRAVAVSGFVEHKEFATGDVVADFRAAKQYAFKIDTNVMFSSSCDQFVRDNPGYSWFEDADGWEWIVKDGDEHEAVPEPDVEKETCWMCGGWGFIHPLDTGDKWHGAGGKTGKVYVWAASRGSHLPGDVICPVCHSMLTCAPFESAYPGDALSITERVW